MTLEEAKALLSTAKRDECRDHAFGDCEVYWRNAAEEDVASGYFGGGSSEVGIGETTFTGDDADALRQCGASVQVGRNDSTGPDEYREGDCMPGLTLDGVLRELTHPDYDPDDDWAEYARLFTLEMRQSYRRERASWTKLLERQHVVLLCFCPEPHRCHRTVLARDILPKLGAVYAGEVRL